MSHLAPCPFCGSSDVSAYAHREPGWGLTRSARCDGCDLTVEWDDCADGEQATADLARALWNRRTPIATGTAKLSQCCPGEHLVPMHGTNTKLCTGCKIEQPWPLEPGQKPTFK